MFIFTTILYPKHQARGNEMKYLLFVDLHYLLALNKFLVLCFKPQAMETYVANIPKEVHVLALEDKSNKTADPAKRPAPKAGGCRVEGFVRVKRVYELH
jgi:hypothetical protein